MKRTAMERIYFKGKKVTNKKGQERQEGRNVTEDTFAKSKVSFAVLLKKI